jgi:hypothetical protein
LLPALLRVLLSIVLPTYHSNFAFVTFFAASNRKSFSLTPTPPQSAKAASGGGNPFAGMAGMEGMEDMMKGYF